MTFAPARLQLHHRRLARADQQRPPLPRRTHVRGRLAQAGSTGGSGDGGGGGCVAVGAGVVVTLDDAEAGERADVAPVHVCGVDSPTRYDGLRLAWRRAVVRGAQDERIAERHDDDVYPRAAGRAARDRARLLADADVVAVRGAADRDDA